jgi:membrane-associated phospholipid phosphatase
MRYMIAGLLTIIVGGLLPAYGVYEWYGVLPDPSQASALARTYELRNLIVDVSAEDGLVSFPSFHTALALLIAYALYEEKKSLFRGFFFLNLMVIFSCVSTGAHYLIDIIGGVVLFGITVKADQWIEKRFINSRLSHLETSIS